MEITRNRRNKDAPSARWTFLTMRNTRACSALFWFTFIPTGKLHQNGQITCTRRLRGKDREHFKYVASAVTSSALVRIKPLILWRYSDAFISAWARSGHARVALSSSCSSSCTCRSREMITSMGHAYPTIFASYTTAPVSSCAALASASAAALPCARDYMRPSASSGCIRARCSHVGLCFILLMQMVLSLMCPRMIALRTRA